ncbi:MAG: hypothetical protein ACRELD_03245 [Longimicrobiales bacterium]
MRFEPEHMLRHCLFCDAALAADASAPATAARWAYDPLRGRAWHICPGCARWNLALLEGRSELIEALERGTRMSGRLLIATANVALFEAADTVVVRVGRAGLDEQAWWRYGRVLRDRQLSFRSLRTRMGMFAGGAASYLGGKVGLFRRIPSAAWDDSQLTEGLRWWHFGSLAWHGRSRCVHCRSVLRALSFDDTWWVHPLVEPRGRLAVGVPCQRCDPWTPDKLFRIRGGAAELLLRRILAYQNIAGGSDRAVLDAACAIQEAGSATSFTHLVASRRASLWRLGPTLALALEIALNDSAERRALVQQARTLETIWRTEEEIARIVDEELTPRPTPLPPLPR